MKGWKTILFGMLLVIGAPALNYLAGVDWTSLVGPVWSGVIVGVIAIALRLVTTTPAFSSQHPAEETLQLQQAQKQSAGPGSANFGAKALILFFLALGSLLMLHGPARAADVLAKPAFALPTPTPCLPTSCSGFYAGVNLTGTMTNANVIGNGINGSFAGGGQAIGAQLGYQFANGTWFFGPEVDADYVVGGNPVVNGGAPAKYRIGEILKVGTQLATLLGMQQPAGQATPGIPAALANSVISPYLFFGAVETGIGQGWQTGAGVEFAIAQNWFVDTRYSYINYGSASVSPTQTVNSENLVSVGFNYKF